VTANNQWTPQFKDFDGVTMARVPAGCFMMGLSASDIATFNEEFGYDWFTASGPQSTFCFFQPFWIDKTDVTQAQFKQFGGTAAHSSNFTGDNRPVESITWFEARFFCAKRGARLPTEAEWEYAARGPDDLQFPWGNNWNPSMAVWKTSQTADVGSIPAGASWVGAWDMAGNVWNWTSTIYDQTNFPYPYKATDLRESSSDTKSTRVVRGGSWRNNFTTNLRAAYRTGAYPDDEYDGRGFRCARS
jgi:formylglycine-generating enzyme required for sulfatase activity